MFHRISEEEVVLPEVRRLSLSYVGVRDGRAPSPDLAAATAADAERGTSATGGGIATTTALEACEACSGQHASEVALFDDLGRRLGDLRALVRRGRKVCTAMCVCGGGGG